MKVLLIDVDSKIPNIALMKLSTYYKSKGYIVDLKQLNYSYYPHKKHTVIDAIGYEQVFVSVTFKQNKERVVVENSRVSWGGVGYSLDIKLPKYIDKCYLDYSIYPDNDTSYGFITRGCTNKCYFCVVPEKEGMIYRENEIDDIVKHKKVKFLDNNILAFEGHLDILWELFNKNIRCQFNQGLDIRKLNHNNMKILSRLNYLGEYIFAFDNISDLNIVNFGLKLFKRYVHKNWKAKFFLYCHPNMSIKDNVIFRIYWCKENKVLPYFMRDESCWGSIHHNLYVDLAAWCNQPSLFKKLTFEQFMNKRHTNKERIEEVLRLIQ